LSNQKIRNLFIRKLRDFFGKRAFGQQIVELTLETLIHEFGGSGQNLYREANHMGGLGVLMGCLRQAYLEMGVDLTIVMPFYHWYWGWMTQEKSSYKNLHWDWMTKGEVFYRDSPAQFVCDLVCDSGGENRTIRVWKVGQKGNIVYGLECPDVFNELYITDPWQKYQWPRFQQELLFGRATPLLLGKEGIKPDIICINEGNTAMIIPTIEKNPGFKTYFKDTKYVFRTHTGVAAAWEKIPRDWLGDLITGFEKYVNEYREFDLTHLAIGESDKTIAVSEHYAHILKTKIFPQYSENITFVPNGSSRKIWVSPRIQEIEKNIDMFKLEQAHQENKKDLIESSEEVTERTFSTEEPIIALNRRFAVYKNQLPMLAPIIEAICAERNQIVNTPLGPLQGLGAQMFIAGMAHENNHMCREWMEEFGHWMSRPKLNENFIFIPGYNAELRKISIWGCDIWLDCPWPSYEAHGTTSQVALMNGKVVVTSSDAYKKIIIEGKNGYFLNPYDTITLYDKLKKATGPYYAFIEKGDDRWLRQEMNAFQTGKSLDALRMVRKCQRIFKGVSS